ncbi:MAG: hypothetical protein EHM28_03705 [Spirochaetaceae bacterium]|nr:MAG: hypothetical protein EHM28_03705 [Spirochaetaceae bacterium]
MLTEDRLDELTTQYSGDYSLNHTKRILRIIPLIGEDYKDGEKARITECIRYHHAVNAAKTRL